MHRYKIKQNVCPIACSNVFHKKPKLITPIPRPFKPRQKKKRLVQNEICGNIKQNCNGEFVTYWRSFGITPLPSGSVTVLNMSNCIMSVRTDLDGDGISETILFTLTERDQSKSITLGTISNLEVSCEGVANEMCRGKFCIEIHYEK
ncbi:S-Ena type endospore appendage [Neobacillus sp. NPDC093182]|uniref:S-Ena type endospore appendage n=1 Tax=Neobacillus sp. NPDC093182 TaxID=3364297 RepID=UPI0037F7B934